MLPRFALMFSVSMLFLVPGCADSPSNPTFECASDADCGSGRVCVRSSDGQSTVCQAPVGVDASDTAQVTDSAVTPDTAPGDTGTSTDSRVADTAATDTSAPDTQVADTQMDDTTPPVPCGGACTGSLMCCSDECVDLSVHDRNCGACGTVCPITTGCCEGGCGGAGDETCCPGVGWADLTADRQHCGTCSNACASGAVCEDGLCISRVFLDGDTATPSSATAHVGHAVVFVNATTDWSLRVSLSNGLTSPEFGPSEFWPFFPENVGEVFFTEINGGAAGKITVE